MLAETTAKNFVCTTCTRHLNKGMYYLAKLTNVRRVVSSSWEMIKGPSILIRGTLKNDDIKLGENISLH